MKIIFFSLFFISLECSAQVFVHRDVMLMGSKFGITLHASDSGTANKFIDSAIAEISRIEYLISDWKYNTQVSDINRNAGINPVKVSKEVFDLTQRAIALSKLTNGAFDISFAAMEKIWKFDGSMTQLPTTKEIKNSISKVGYKNIILDSINSTVFLKLKGMKIGFGALGEGYAADRCYEILINHKIFSGLINGSGDIRCWSDSIIWKIGINNPFNSGELLAVIPLQNSAITTSGSYEKFAEINGKRYSHIINPSTGYPATGLISVTVIGPSAEVANGLSTSMMVLGKKKGLKLLKKFKGYKAILITDSHKIYLSCNLKKRQWKKWRSSVTIH